MKKTMDLRTQHLPALSDRHQALLGRLLLGAASFAAAAAQTGRYPSLLCAALAACFPSETLAVFLPAAAYYLIFSHFTAGLVGLCSVLTIGVLHIAAHRGGKPSNPVIPAALCAAVTLFFSFAVSAAEGAPGETAAARSVASMTSAVFVYSLRTLINEHALTRTVTLCGRNAVCAAAVYMSAVSALASVRPGIDLGRVIGCTAVIAAAKRLRTSGGAAVGAMTAAAMLTGAPDLAYDTMLLSAAGLVCGAFAELGVFAVCLSFIGVCAVGTATSAGADFSLFVDASAGAVLYALIPQGAVRSLTARFFAGREAADTVSRSTSSRLGFAASSLGEIRQQLALAAAAMDKKNSRRSLTETVFTSLCRGCEHCCICHKDPHCSNEKFARLEQVTMQYNGLADSDVRRCFPDCLCPELVADSFNYAYRAYLDSRAAGLRVGEMRSLISEQLCVMEDILSDLSCRVGRIRSVDSSLSERVRDHFARLGCLGARACVYLDEAGFRHCEVFLSSDAGAEPVELAIAVSDICDCLFDIPAVSESDRLTRLIFSELPLYETESGSFSASSADNGYSGDTFAAVKISPCESCAVLSDGMGTGKRARLDSMLAVSLAARLLTAGISMRSAVRMINSALRVKGWDESFATLDILRLDLCAGTAELLKAGASPTYLCRDGAVKRFGSEAFPAGILDVCTPDLFSCKLFDGDVIVMASDGVQEETVREAADLIADKTAEEAAAYIGELAMERAGERRDDISAAVFKIRLREKERRWV